MDVASAAEAARAHNKSRSTTRSMQRNPSNMQQTRYSSYRAASSADHGVDGSMPLEEMLPKLAKRKSSQPQSTDNETTPSSPPASDISERIRLRSGSRPSLLLEQSDGLGQVEALRTADIQTDANSAASQAFSALKDRRPSVRADDNRKIVDGREIRQDHELYGMTYGMMLGIRVLVRRRYMIN